MRFSASIKNFLVQFVQTQLVVTIVALPILISWGLGISVMTFLGNLLFAPVLTMFLIFSSLILFTELMGIPNELLTQTLDYFTHIWHEILRFGSSDWIVYFAHPGFLLLITIPIILYFVLTHRTIKTNSSRIFALSIILGATTVGLVGYQKLYIAKTAHTICYQEKLTIEHTPDQKLIVIDNGFFAQKKTAEKIVAFEVKPYLVKKYGNLPIAEIKLQAPSAGSFAAAKELCETWVVHKVSLPYFNEKLSKFAWKKFFELQEILKEKNIIFER